jgi:hypothetical protein
MARTKRNAVRRGATAPWDTLPAEVLARVLQHLAGYVRTLSAVACVSRAWRDAAAEPSLWAQLQQLPRRAAARLTDERLAALVLRARGGLARLDLRGARGVSDEGLNAALQQPYALDTLVEFTADAECRQLTAQGVARALASRSGQLRRLGVAGLLCGPQPAVPGYLRNQQPNQLWRTQCLGVVASLRALLASRGVLEGTKTCDWDTPCSRLCDDDNYCSHDACCVALCDDHMDNGFEMCADCEKLLCSNCLRFGRCEQCVTALTMPESPAPEDNYEEEEWW